MVVMQNHLLIDHIVIAYDISKESIIECLEEEGKSTTQSQILYHNLSRFHLWSTDWGWLFF